MNAKEKTLFIPHTLIEYFTSTNYQQNSADAAIEYWSFNTRTTHIWVLHHSAKHSTMHFESPFFIENLRRKWYLNNMWNKRISRTDALISVEVLQMSNWLDLFFKKKKTTKNKSEIWAVIRNSNYFSISIFNLFNNSNVYNWTKSSKMTVIMKIVQNIRYFHIFIKTYELIYTRYWWNIHTKWNDNETKKEERCCSDFERWLAPF